MQEVLNTERIVGVLLQRESLS